MPYPISLTESLPPYPLRFSPPDDGGNYSLCELLRSSDHAADMDKMAGTRETVIDKYPPL